MQADAAGNLAACQATRLSPRDVSEGDPIPDQTVFPAGFRSLIPSPLRLSSFTWPVLPQVNLVLDDGRSLGLMIRGGAEYALGIYITGVDQGSAAECGGLKVFL